MDGFDTQSPSPTIDVEHALWQVSAGLRGLATLVCTRDQAAVAEHVAPILDLLAEKAESLSKAILP